MTRPLARALVLLALLLAPAAASAQRLELSVSPGVISFAPVDPDSAPVLLSAPITLTYRIRQLNGPWQLTVLASGDLMSGGSSVDISNVSWVATPAPPFQNGTLNQTVAQVLATGVGNVNPARTGSLTFRLKNSWTYDTGTYTQTVVFTLSTP